jgi:hypothetical protein
MIGAVTHPYSSLWNIFDGLEISNLQQIIFPRRLSFHLAYPYKRKVKIVSCLAVRRSEQNVFHSFIPMKSLFS